MDALNPKIDKAAGYHLFFMPSGELADNLQHIINEFSKKYQGPIFKPHITLLGGISGAYEGEVVAKTKQLAGMMKPFEIELGEVGVQDTYFRALYCKAKLSPQIEDCYRKAMEIFGVQDLNAYVPHLSLFYGNNLQSEKDQMIASLKLPPDMKFWVDRVYLYRTEGRAENWVEVGEYAF